MRGKRGVTNVMLNAVIGLVLIGITFSTAFFLYRSFSNALTTSQVTKGFENFVEPIRQVCQGSNTAFSSDLDLPTWEDSVYGIIQTKVSTYSANMPLPMRNCVGSYCLCLFKLRKPVRPLIGAPANKWDKPWDFWNPTDSGGLFTAILDYFDFDTFNGVLASAGVSNFIPEHIGSPAPIWHFNKPGLRLLPAFMNRIVEFLIVRMILKVLEMVVVKIIAKLVCDALCYTSGVASAPCLVGCFTALYTIIIAISRAASNAIVTYLEEITEPFILVNSPLNFMSVPIDVTTATGDASARKFLEWTNTGILTTDYSGITNWCGAGTGFLKTGDCFMPAMQVSKISASDWEAIGLSALEGAIEGAIEGFFKGFTKGLTAVKRAKKAGAINVGEAAEKAMTKEAAEQTAGILKRMIISVGEKAIKHKKLIYLSKGLIKTASWGLRMELKKSAAYKALDYDLPTSFRPLATVRALLGVRREMMIDNFVSMWAQCDPSTGGCNLLDLITSWGQASPPEPPNYDYTWDDSVEYFENFDIINCVSIAELGPRCDGDDAILMDYSYDTFLSYRITDPINNPAKAFFCGFDPNKQDFGFDIIQILIDAGKAAVTNGFSGVDPASDATGTPCVTASDCGSTDAYKCTNSVCEKDPGVWGFIINTILDGVGWLLQTVIGEWLLAGMSSMQGLFMECVSPEFVAEPKTEYFQYWIPYPDLSGYTQGDGGIGIMVASYATSASQLGCQNGAIRDWKNCACGFYNRSMAEIQANITAGVVTSSVGNILLIPYQTLHTTLGCAYAITNYATTHTNLNSVETTTDADNMLDYKPVDEGGASCYITHYTQYLGCIPGIHVQFGGAVQ